MIFLVIKASLSWQQVWYHALTDVLNFKRTACFNSCQILTAAFFFFSPLVLFSFFIFITLIVGIFYSFLGQFCPLKWKQDNAELPWWSACSQLRYALQDNIKLAVTAESACTYKELKHVACERAIWKEIWRRKLKPDWTKAHHISSLSNFRYYYMFLN